jgi:hypothetical protein
MVRVVIVTLLSLLSTAAFAGTRECGGEVKLTLSQFQDTLSIPRGIEYKFIGSDSGAVSIRCSQDEDGKATMAIYIARISSEVPQAVVSMARPGVCDQAMLALSNFARTNLNPSVDAVDCTGSVRFTSPIPHQINN